MDGHLTFNKNAKELVKAASRVLGSLMTKVNIAGGMTYKVYNKLYTSMIEPILMYGSGVVSFHLYKIEHVLYDVNTFYLLENICPMYHCTVTWDGHPVTLSSI